MPRHAKPTAPPPPPNTLIVDNGAHTIKAGFAPSEPDVDAQCQIIPNCIARGRDRRVWIGAQLEKCKDFGEMAFRRPVEKGYLVNWEAEKEIWESAFFDKDAKLKCDPHDTTLVLSEAPNSPAALQTNTDQMVFEEFEFTAYYRCLGATLNSYNPLPPPSSPDARPPEALLLLDTSFSHTTVTPVLHHAPIHPAIRRLDLGGKHLTNYLKELVSVRHYNMMDEVQLMSDVKEAVCYVSSSFASDLDRTWKGNRHRLDIPTTTSATTPPNTNADIAIDYILPNYNTHPSTPGHTRPHSLLKQPTTDPAAEAAFMTLTNERFTVPELLFSPADIGLKAAGLPELIMQALASVPGGLWPALLGNLVVVGGNARLPGLVERLKHDLRALAPSEVPVRVLSAADPVTATFHGGVNLARQAEGRTLRGLSCSREEYLENGAGWVARKFGAGGGRE